MAATAVPLPGGARSWLPAEVLVDGAPTTALRAQPDGVLWLRVEPGRHRVLLRGPLPDRDAVELPLPLSPSAVTASVTGWALHGLLDDHRAESTLQLTRVRETSDTEQRTVNLLEILGLCTDLFHINTIRFY